MSVMQGTLRRAAPLAGRATMRFSLAQRASTLVARGAKSGDYVAVHYTGTLDDGSTFDSSRARDPLEFQVGSGKVIKGFDLAVTGLEVGGKRKVRIDPKDAYGEPDPQLVINVPTANAPDKLSAGDKVQLSNGMVATVKAVTPEAISLDLNHELAGKALTFDVELMKLWAGERLQKATFGAGCFWGPELAFQRVPGVVTTEVGYSQGAAENPTYEAVCTGETGHAEVVQVVYDPDVIAYERLLDVFWAKHDPTQLNRQGGDTGTQYRSGIYTHTPEQRAAALKSKELAQARFKSPIVTEIEDIKSYYPAEPYHQQYLARGGRFGNAQSPAKGCSDPIRCYG